MSALGDGFVALPGGLGTLDELIDAWTGWQLQLHNKPIGALNIDDYWTPLVDHMECMALRGFLARDVLDTLNVESDPAALIAHMQ